MSTNRNPSVVSKQQVARATDDPDNFLSPIEDIIEDARNGRMFIMVDDEERENEGDLIVAAELITEQQVDNTCIDLLTDSVSFFSSLRPLPPHCPMSRLTFECAVPCRWPSW